MKADNKRKLREKIEGAILEFAATFPDDALLEDIRRELVSVIDACVARRARVKRKAGKQT